MPASAGKAKTGRCVHDEALYKFTFTFTFTYTRHPHTNHTCLYFAAPMRHRPLAGTHCAYSRRDGQAELTWVAGYIPIWMSGTRNWTRTGSPIPVLTEPDLS